MEYILRGATELASDPVSSLIIKKFESRTAYRRTCGIDMKFV